METLNQDVIKTEEESQAEVVFSLEQGDLLHDCIIVLKDKCAKYNQGKFQNLARYSDESLVEYLIQEGIKLTANGLEADEKRRNQDAFAKAMGELKEPDSDDAIQLQNYFMKVSALKRKFKQGGSQKQV